METLIRVRHRAVITGSIGASAVSWLLWWIDPTAGDSPLQPMIISTLLLANVALTILRPQAKRTIVAAVQRTVVNPIVRALFRIGFVPFGYALLETSGRKSGKPRRTPVGNGMCGNIFWIIAEHGTDAGYVRNLMADPRVRLKLRHGLRFVWIDGVATVTTDDPLLRQRELCGRHPLRFLNAITVRTLGTDPVAVRVDPLWDSERVGPTSDPWRQPCPRLSLP